MKVTLAVGVYIDEQVVLSVNCSREVIRESRPFDT